MEPYMTILRKLLEIEPALNPTHIMVDFEKASINALEEHFLAVVWMLLPLLSKYFYEDPIKGIDESIHGRF